MSYSIYVKRNSFERQILYTAKMNHSSFNFYNILGSLPSASKAEITKAVAIAMKRKQRSVNVTLKFQRVLMNQKSGSLLIIYVRFYRLLNVLNSRFFWI